MKRCKLIPCLLMTGLLLLPACGAIPAEVQEVHSNLPRDLSPQVTDSDLAVLVNGNNDFAFALYRQIAGGDGNLIYSPYSISIALAMTYAGAKGDTAAQMAQALSFTLPEDRLHPAFNKLALELESRSQGEDPKADPAFQLNIANSLWGQTGYPFKQSFLDVLAQNYAAGMRLVDFSGNPDGARQMINNWISQSTNKKIQNMLSPEAIQSLTRLVLANAVYFKADWLDSFKPENTSPGSFDLPDGSSVQVPMMSRQGGMNFRQGKGYRAVELPYANQQTSMLIVLPDKGRFSDIQAKWNDGLIQEIATGMQSTDVALTLPKFKFEWTAGSLKEGLEALGMADAFDPVQADFSGMGNDHDLYIGDVVHKAYIAVDEKGTEAAAATVVVVVTSAAIPPAERLIVDRPFFFLIRDNPTGAILFVGQVTNPAAS